jgi:CRISPR/Cas system CSM-associated protein Csm3 (group 7 of RAMP superfamily)
MTHHQPFFYIARLVLETCTPLSIASGRTDGIADNLLVRDANNLPAIPGSSLAGVLRHAYQRHYDENGKSTNTNALFGSAKNEDTGNPSCVHFSWGYLHNGKDIPIEGLLKPDDLRFQDKVVKDALQTTPIRRDHVKLNHRGASDTKNQGKFDRTSLTTGHRFSIELSLWSDEKNDPRWQQLLDLLKRPDFRLGGGTRRGLGKLKIVRGCTGEFNLMKPENADESEEFKKFSELTQALTNNTHLQPLKESKSLEPLPQISLALTPLDGYGYRFGGGIEPLVNKQIEVDNQPADLLAVTEHCVTWETGKGTLTKKKQIVIPASSVKGAISHRVAYHYNILDGKFADKMSPEIYAECLGENNEAVQALFGYVKEKQNEKDKDIAQIGCLIFDDIYLDHKTRTSLKPVEYAHNSIDRFTAGVREGALFFEEVLTDTQSFKLDITVTLPLNENTKEWKITESEKEAKRANIRQALHLTLTDLTEGRLALGAGGGRGHGYFRSELKYDKQWLELETDIHSKTAQS